MKLYALGTMYKYTLQKNKLLKIDLINLSPTLWVSLFGKRHSRVSFALLDTAGPHWHYLTQQGLFAITSLSRAAFVLPHSAGPHLYYLIQQCLFAITTLSRASLTLYHSAGPH